MAWRFLKDFATPCARFASFQVREGPQDWNMPDWARLYFPPDWVGLGFGYTGSSRADSRKKCMDSHCHTPRRMQCRQQWLRLRTNSERRTLPRMTKSRVWGEEGWVWGGVGGEGWRVSDVGWGVWNAEWSLKGVGWGVWSMQWRVTGRKVDWGWGCWVWCGEWYGSWGRQVGRCSSTCSVT